MSNRIPAPWLNIVNIRENQIAESKRITEEMIERNREELDKKVKDVSGKLAGSATARKMPLKVFTDIFYPMFAGKITDEAEVERLMGAWNVHATSAYLQVPIVHDATGELLFYVPPMLAPELTGNSRTESSLPPMHVLANHCEQLRHAGRRHEAEAVEMMTMETKLPSEAATGWHAIKNMMHWNEISKALGEPPIYPIIAKRVAELEGTADAPANPVGNQDVKPTESNDGSTAQAFF